MFFKECERLAERRPLLAAVIRQVDAQLSKVGAGGLVRSDDLASSLRADPNQVESVLSMLTHSGLLESLDMVECPHCQMAALRSDFESGLEEDGEYACTSCERPLAAGAVAAVTTYRHGPKWKAIPKVKEGASKAKRGEVAALPGAPASVLDESGWYAPSRLAQHFGVSLNALRKRLNRYRDDHDLGWRENTERGPREPLYDYRLKDVKPIIEELQSASERPAR